MAAAARERLRGKIEILFVRPDYYADRPRACMDGWARRYIVVTPDGVVLPCHQAREHHRRWPSRTCATRPLADIWRDSPALRGVPRRGLDAGAVPDLRRAARGLRRLPLPGVRAARATRRATDPACALAPRHDVVPRRAHARRAARPAAPRADPPAPDAIRPHERPAIEVEDLAKRYGDVEAVRGIGFSVGAGEIFGFLGPNGAGKTTTIKILCTLLQPTSGRARLAGLDVATSPGEVRRRIGVVFQDPALDDRLTAEENLMLHAVAYRVPRAERAARIDEALRFVDLHERGART